MATCLLTIFKATEILSRLHANGNPHHPLIVAEVQEILDALEQEKKVNGGWKELVSPSMIFHSLWTLKFSSAHI